GLAQMGHDLVRIEADILADARTERARSPGALALRRLSNGLGEPAPRPERLEPDPALGRAAPLALRGVLQAAHVQLGQVVAPEHRHAHGASDLPQGARKARPDAEARPLEVLE